MKKNITEKSVESKLTRTMIGTIQEQARNQKLTIGLDVGDRKTNVCILDEQGDIFVQDQLASTKTGVSRLLEKLSRCRVALEVGTHSPWMSRLIAGFGHEVIVANPRNVAWIVDSRRKNDRLDAEKLARLARLDPKVLSPVQHRSEEAQRDLVEIRTRAVLVEARTKIVNSVRGQTKALGYRLASCDADLMDADLSIELPEAARLLLQPLLETIAGLTAQILKSNQRIHEVAKRYPEIELLTAISGVGELTALTFVLTIDNEQRFNQSRAIGSYLGLVPGQSQSGKSDPQQRITKEGDRMMRFLLVQCAHCILKRNAPDSDLKRWGLAKIDEQTREAVKKGGKAAPRKKRVLVAVARKLAVLMHRLWVNGEVYDPLYLAKQRTAAALKSVA